MPILLVAAGVGALFGSWYSGNQQSQSSSAISTIEGVVMGAALGVGAAAVYFALRKV